MDKTTEPLNSTRDIKIVRFLEKKASLIVPGIILIISFFIFKDYLLLKKVYLFKDIGSDTVNAYYPQFLQFVNYIHNYGIPKWSFTQGMGQNIFPSNAGNFSLYLYLLFKPENIPYCIVYIEVLKLIIAGTLFYHYLRVAGFSFPASLLSCLVFTFSGFMIVGGGWYVFSYEGLCVAFLLYSFERFFLNAKHWYYLPFSIAMIAAFQPFYLFMYGIFIAFYATMRYLSKYDFQWNRYFKFNLRLIAASLLGLAISAVFFFPAVDLLFQSPRAGDEVSYFKLLSDTHFYQLASKIEYASILLRTYSSDLMGASGDFMGIQNYLEAPMTYCGLITLILVPQFFAIMNRRNKILFGIGSLVLIISLLFPYFRYMLWLFSGDYYRGFSLMIAIYLIFLAVNALEKIIFQNVLNLKFLVITLLVLIGLLFFPHLNEFENKSLLKRIILFLILYAALISLYVKSRHKLIILFLIISVVSYELVFLSSITVNNRVNINSSELIKKSDYNDYTNEAVTYLKNLDKSFYRINKDYTSLAGDKEGFNDAMAQNYYGTMSYNSFNQKYYIEFLKGLDVIRHNNESDTRWTKGLIERPYLETVVNTKYFLSKSPDNNLGNSYPDNSLENYQYDFLATIGDVKIYRNPNYLPLGFTYDSYISEIDFRKFNKEEKDLTLLNAFVINEIDDYNYRHLKRITPESDTVFSYTVSDYPSYIALLKQDTLHITDFNPNDIKGTIRIDKPKLLFFSIPYDKGWSSLVNGKSVKPSLVSFGFMGIPLDRGDYTIELIFEPPFVKIGLFISMAGILIWLVLFMYSKKKTV